MALALDGSVHTKSTFVANSGSISLSTTSANDIIVIILHTGSFLSTGNVTISSAHTTGWQQRGTTQWNGSQGIDINEYVGKASTALTNETITISGTDCTGDFDSDAFGISGADTTAIFDSHSGLPSQGNTNALLSISTTNSNTFIFASYGMNTSTPTEGSGWTKISGTDFLLTEYKIVSVAQSSLSCTIGTGAGLEETGTADAIVQASGTVSAAVGSVPYNTIWWNGSL